MAPAVSDRRSAQKDEAYYLFLFSEREQVRRELQQAFPDDEVRGYLFKILENHFSHINMY